MGCFGRKERFLLSLDWWRRYVDVVSEGTPEQSLKRYIKIIQSFNHSTNMILAATMFQVLW